MNASDDSLLTESTVPRPDQALDQIYAALIEKGCNPTMQIVGYLLTEDPTYIPDHNHARSLITRIYRDELLKEIVRFYFEQKYKEP